MKKIQLIELIKTIKKTFVSFISIIFFIVLGTALFLGIGWSTKAFVKTLDKTLNDTSVYDLDITYPYGLDDEAVNLILSIDDVEKAEGVYSTEAFFNHSSRNYQAKIISLTNDINTYSKVLGNLPSKIGEIAVERFWAEAHDVKVGDVITFKHNDKATVTLNDILKEDLDLFQNKKLDDDGMNYLNCDTFVVTALLETGTYINHFRVTYGVSSVSGIPNDCVMYVTKDSFDKDAFAGYSEIVVLCPSFHNYSYDSLEYQEEFDSASDKVNEVLNEYCLKKYNSLQTSISNLSNEIHNKYDDGIKEYNDALKEIEDGEKKIKDGKKELADAKKELENGQKEIDAGWAEVNAGKKEIAQNEEYLKYGSITQRVINGYIQTYSYVDDNKDSIIEAITFIHDAKNNNDIWLPLQTDLPNDCYPLEVIDPYFNELPNPYDASKLASNYSKMLRDIQENENFDSVEELFNTYEEYIGTLSEGTYKTNVEKIKTYLNTLLNVPEEIFNLANNTFELYRTLVDGDIPADVYDNEIIKQINEILSVTDIKVEDLLQFIIDEVPENYSTFDELFDAFSDQMQFVEDMNEPTFLIVDFTISGCGLIIDEAYKELNAGKAKLNEAINKLYDAQNKLNEGWDEYNDNVKLLAKKEKELLDGKKELENASDELEQAKKDIEEFDKNIPVLKDIDCSVLGRKSNGGVASAGVANEIMGNIKYTMALLFIIVGAFVCYSALSRIVYEQTVLIGTKKALGFNSFEITSFYVLYAFIATLIGSIVGTLLARFVIEKLIVIILAENYTVGELVMHFSIIDSLLFFAFELAISISATLLACNKNLKRKTTELLANQNQLLGKKRFFEDFIIWKRMPLLIKTIINNCLNDTKRVFATLIGIIGSCSLLVCAIVMINNINSTFDYQMKNVTAFDSLIYIDTENDTVVDNISKILDENNIDYTTSVNSTYIVKSPNDSYLSDAFFSYNDDKFKDYFHITLDGVPITNTNGIYITKAYAMAYDLEIGDSITFYDSNGEELNAPIAGIFDFYLLRGQLIVPREYYKTLFNDDPKVNTFVLNKGSHSLDELYNLLNSVDGFISVFDYEAEAIQLYSSLTSSIMIIVVAFFVLSVILALLVLLNLMVMFVNEKKRELIVLMINGFNRSDAKKYIYGDTIVLTIIGIFFGILLGITVGFATLKSLDSECVTVMRNINVPSLLLCALVTAFLTAITCLIALRKIDKFSLTDINKA